MSALLEQLDSPKNHLQKVKDLDLNALPRIRHYLTRLVCGDTSPLSQSQSNLLEMFYSHQFEAVI